MNREEYFKIIENVNHITLENALKIIKEYCILKDKKESDIDKLIIFFKSKSRDDSFIFRRFYKIFKLSFFNKQN